MPSQTHNSTQMKPSHDQVILNRSKCCSLRRDENLSTWEKNTSEEGRKLTNSTNIWRRDRKSRAQWCEANCPWHCASHNHENNDNHAHDHGYSHSHSHDDHNHDQIKQPITEVLKRFISIESWRPNITVHPLTLFLHRPLPSLFLWIL